MEELSVERLSIQDGKEQLRCTGTHVCVVCCDTLVSAPSETQVVLGVNSILLSSWYYSLSHPGSVLLRLLNLFAVSIDLLSMIMQHSP